MAVVTETDLARLREDLASLKDALHGLEPALRETVTVAIAEAYETAADVYDRARKAAEPCRTWYAQGLHDGFEIAARDLRRTALKLRNTAA
jgi:hypothetical protein